MIYRVFRESEPKTQIAEINDPTWPLLEKDEKIPLTIDGKDGLYLITEVGGFNMDANRLVIDLWVKDFFPKAK